MNKLQQCLDYIKEHDQETFTQQLAMVQIPAPSYLEEEKGNYVFNRFKEIGLENVHRDEVGNILGYIYGNGPTIMIAGHLDTVFPIETDLSIKQVGNRYICPGINDDTRAVAELFIIAQAIIDKKLQLNATLIFVANVCEEGLGDLKGVKHLFKGKSCDYFITIDDGTTGKIIYCATGSHRYLLDIYGKGGHSFGDFGLPNPIHALGRIINDIADYDVPEHPKTTFNVGIIEGGTSVNTIASHASLLIDLRSDSQEELDKYTKQLFETIEKEINKENSRWKSNHKLTYTITEKGKRPAGRQDVNLNLIQLAAHANEMLGIETVLYDSGSTDANIPISLGIPAICVGRGGKEGNVHTTDEWFENEEAYLGPQRDLLLLYLLSKL